MGFIAYWNFEINLSTYLSIYPLLTNLSIEANSENPEQTAQIGAVWSWSTLFSKSLLKHFIRWQMLTTFVMTGASRVNPFKITRLECPSTISPFPIWWFFFFFGGGGGGGGFRFCSNLSEQTLETLIRRRVLWRLIWVYTVNIYHTKVRFAYTGMPLTTDFWQYFENS